MFTVNGSGADIWNTADQFQFVDQPLSGDGTVIARITSQSDTDPWAKAGLMIRASTAAGDVYVDLFQTPGNGVNFQYRTTLNGTAAGSSSGPVITNPLWLKLTRTGNTFNGYSSTDGVNYTLVGTIALTMPTTVLAGLEVTSHNAASTSTATFDNVSVTPAPTTALPLPWIGGDIGAPVIAGSATDTNGTFTVTGSGSGLGTNTGFGVHVGSDQFQFVDRMTTGNTTIVAQVVSQTSTHTGAVSGVMIRATSDASSPYVAVLQTVGSGLTFEYRTASGAIAISTQNGPVVKGPVYLKLVRSGNTFTGYYSTNGTTYTKLGSVVIALASNTFTGLAVTSSLTTSSNTATIDAVSVTTS